VLKILLFFGGFHQFFLLGVHYSAGFEHSFFHIFDFHLISRRQMFDLVLKFLDNATESGDFHTLFIQSLIHFVLFVSVDLLDIVDVLMKLFNLLIKLVSFSMPFLSFFLLSFKPFTMLSLDIIKLIVKLVNSSLVESLHLLDFQVQLFDFFAFSFNSLLEISLFFHELFHINTSVLKKLSVRNMSQ